MYTSLEPSQLCGYNAIEDYLRINTPRSEMVHEMNSFTFNRAKTHQNSCVSWLNAIQWYTSWSTPSPTPHLLELPTPHFLFSNYHWPKNTFKFSSCSFANFHAEIEIDKLLKMWKEIHIHSSQMFLQNFILPNHPASIPNQYPNCSAVADLSLSLSLSHTHTHANILSHPLSLFIYCETTNFSMRLIFVNYNFSGSYPNFRKLTPATYQKSCEKTFWRLNLQLCAVYEIQKFVLRIFFSFTVSNSLSFSWRIQLWTAKERTSCSTVCVRLSVIAQSWTFLSRTTQIRTEQWVSFVLQTHNTFPASPKSHITRRQDMPHSVTLACSFPSELTLQERQRLM